MEAAAIALNRFGLGARPGERLPADPRAWLSGQFAAFLPSPPPIAAVADRAAAGRRLWQYRAVRADVRVTRAAAAAKGLPLAKPGAMMSADAESSAPAGQDELVAAIKSIHDSHVAMIGARLEVATTSPAPFVERLVHFWANHFAVSADNPMLEGLAGLLEFEAVRPHVLGRFSDMLLAVEQHPAMLFYLDQNQSIGPDSMAGKRSADRGRKLGLNENLGREIMELHTLGVGGGYTQGDVTELARALTGWRIAGLTNSNGAQANPAGDPLAFTFVPALHEPGTRTIMGRSYSQTGEEQGRAILDDLAKHPSTAKHLATQLARHFAGDDPPPAMVDRLQSAYLRSDGHLPTVYQAIIDSPEAWVATPAKFKQPWEWTVSALRAVGTTALSEQADAGVLNQLGQPTWRPASPAGWDDRAASWAGPDALVRRVDVAQRIAAHADAGLDPRRLAEAVLPGALGESTRTAIARAENEQQGLTLLLVSPEFLRR